MYQGRYRRLVAAVVMMVVVAGLSFSTGSQETTGSGQSTAVPEGVDSWTVDTSPVTIELYIDLPGDWGNYWGNEPVSEKWMDETGVDLEFSTAPDATHQQLNVLVAAGDIPDMVMLQQSLPLSVQLAENDAIWAMDELAKAEAPGLWDYLYNDNKHVILHQRMMFDSMHVYMAPFRHLEQRYFDSPYSAKNLGGVTVIENIYDELGRPAIRSAEDYVELLLQVKENYPEMTPMQSYRDAGPDADGNPNLVAYLLPVAGLQQKYFQRANGDWYKYWEHDDFVELLKLANRLQNEGLVDSAEFTASEADLRANLYNGEVFSELNEDVDNLDTHTTYLQARNPGWAFEMIDGFTIDPSRMEYTWDTLGGGWGSYGIVIPKTSEKASRAARFLDFIYQETTQIEVMFGLEDHGHTMSDGIPTFTEGAREAIETGGRSAVATEYGARAYYLFRNDYWQKVGTLSIASDNLEAAWEIANSNYEDLSFYQGAEAYSLNSEEQKVASGIKDFYETAVTNIVVGSPSDVESSYEEMIETMMDLGLPVLNEYWTEYFNNKSELRAKYEEGL